MSSNGRMPDSQIHTVLDEVLLRLERLELTVALLASLVHPLPPRSAQALQEFAHQIQRERAERETAAHLPEPDLN